MSKIVELPTSENCVVLVDYENEFVVVDVHDGESPQRIGADVLTVREIDFDPWESPIVAEREIPIVRWFVVDGEPYRQGEEFWSVMVTFDNHHQITIYAFGEPRPGLLPDDLHDAMVSLYEYQSYL